MFIGVYICVPPHVCLALKMGPKEYKCGEAIQVVLHADGTLNDPLHLAPYEALGDLAGGYGFKLEWFRPDLS